MKHVSIVLLIVMVSMASAAMTQEKETAEESKPSSFQPKPLDDEWSKWLVGEWKVVSGESDWLVGESGNAVKLDVEEGTDGFKVESGLNGQFLVMRGSGGEMTDEQKKQTKEALKETTNASDEDLERFLSMPFKMLAIQTIDRRTGEVAAYLFDSQRCIAEGRGRRQANKETIEWKWSATGQGATSVGVIEKINDNKFTLSQRYTLPDGRKMGEKAEMIRKKERSESATRMTSHAEDLAAVKQLAKDYHAAWLTDDPEALLALYADDAVLMLSNRPVVTGKGALRALYQHVFENYTHTGSGKQLEVEVAGDLGYIWSTYTATSTPKDGGEPIKDRGNSVCIVRRQHDGSWKVARLIANRDVAPASSK